MDNATWLFFVTPEWYFSTITQPFADPVLTWIPSAGIVCLAVGVILGGIQQRRDLLWFAVSPAASQVLVVVAGFLRGSLAPNVTASAAYLVATLLPHVIGAAFLIYWLKGARVAAGALMVFSVTYAFFAAFVAAMSFTDMWL